MAERNGRREIGFSDIPSPPPGESPAFPSPVPDAGPARAALSGLHLSDGVAQLVLHGSGRRNVIAPAALAGLERALAAVEVASQLKVLVLRGEGRFFCGGADLEAARALAPSEALEFFRRGRALVRRLERLNVLTVAAVNGPALGGGFELALACDLRWAHARAAFGFPECRLGLVPGWGGLRLLLRHLPTDAALELVLRGNYMRARTARSLGLVTRLFPADAFDARLAATLAELASRDVGILRAIKSLAREIGANGGDRWDAAQAAVFEDLWFRRAGSGWNRAWKPPLEA